MLPSPKSVSLPSSSYQALPGFPPKYPTTPTEHHFLDTKISKAKTELVVSPLKAVSFLEWSHHDWWCHHLLSLLFHPIKVWSVSPALSLPILCYLLVHLRFFPAIFSLTSWFMLSSYLPSYSWSYSLPRHFLHCCHKSLSDAQIWLLFSCLKYSLIFP